MMLLLSLSWLGGGLWFILLGCLASSLYFYKKWNDGLHKGIQNKYWVFAAIFLIAFIACAIKMYSDR